MNFGATQRSSRPPRIGMLSTYAPTLCGLASFSAALSIGLEENSADVRVVRVGDGPPSEDPRVAGELVSGSASIRACAELLSQCDVAVIQHGFGIYGGDDGSDVVDVMRALRVPSIVVVHSVPSDPTPGQRSTLEAVTALADRVVVMSGVASRRLGTDFAVEQRKVSIIGHGATMPRGLAVKRAGRPTILTWGLLGPGKGIERVIDAMGTLKELRGQPRYLVAGRTHPKVLATDGEAYRDGLVEQARRTGVGGSVSFEPIYRGFQSQAAMVQSCAVVVLPYDSTDQVTSGVLVDAVASGRPVVATAFPHAVEMLGSGAGLVVPHDDPDAMVDALRRVLSDPRLAGSMAAEGRQMAPAMEWAEIAKSYVTLAQRLMMERQAMV